MVAVHMTVIRMLFRVVIVVVIRIAGVEMILRRLAEGNQQRQDESTMERKPHWPPVWHELSYFFKCT